MRKNNHRRNQRKKRKTLKKKKIQRNQSKIELDEEKLAELL